MVSALSPSRSALAAGCAAALALLVSSCATDPSAVGVDPAVGSYGASGAYPGRPSPFALMDYATLRDRSTWGRLNAHDPSIFFDEASGYYYVYSTDLQKGMLTEPGCQIRRSRNLVDWEFVGWALADGLPQEVAAWASPRSLWAPDCVKVGDEYRLYYSASYFGKQRSAIALAVSSSPEGPFVSRGIVVKTDQGDPVNAIDPTVVTEAESGRQYLFYGSFWGGIRMLPLDAESGLPESAPGDFGATIASRPRSVDGAIEGSYVIRNPANGLYYLFVSYGSLFADYNVRVGRSPSIAGPYLDRNGVAMTDLSAKPDSVGLKIMAGYRFGESQGWVAPGHNSVLRRGDEWFIAHHMRPEDDTSWAYLCVRKLVWTDDGWPIASPLPYAGEIERSFTVAELAGSYDLVAFGDGNPPGNVAVSDTLALSKNGSFAYATGDGKKIRGSWALSGGNRIDLSVREGGSRSGLASSLDGLSFRALPAWDRDEDSAAIALTGLDASGHCVWARAPVKPR